MKNLLIAFTLLVPAILMAQWIPADVPEPVPYDFSNVKFFDVNEGFLMSNWGYFQHTKDGGATWTDQSYTSFEYYVRDVYIFDPFTIVALVDPIFETNPFRHFAVNLWDGLSDWEPVNDTITGTTAVFYLNESLGFCGTLEYDNIDSKSSIIKLSGTGPEAPATQIWQHNSSNQAAYINYIFCPDEQTIIATYASPDDYISYPYGMHNGVLIRSADQGNTWEELINLDYNNYFTKLDQSTDGSCLYATSPDSIYYSMDDGEIWKAQQNTMMTVEMITDQQGFGVFQTSGSMNDTLQITYTEDAFQSWDVQYNHVLDEMPFRHMVNICMTDHMNGWATLDREVLKTNNGGITNISNNTQNQIIELSIHNSAHSNSICVQWPAKIPASQLMVFDAMGRVVYKTPVIDKQHKINVMIGDWPQGIFVVGLINNNQLIASGKFIKY